MATDDDDDDDDDDQAPHSERESGIQARRNLKTGVVKRDWH